MKQKDQQHAASCLLVGSEQNTNLGVGNYRVDYIIYGPILYDFMYICGTMYLSEYIHIKTSRSPNTGKF